MTRRRTWKPIDLLLLLDAGRRFCQRIGRQPVCGKPVLGVELPKADIGSIFHLRARSGCKSAEHRQSGRALKRRCHFEGPDAAEIAGPGVRVVVGAPMPFSDVLAPGRFPVPVVLGVVPPVAGVLAGLPIVGLVEVEPPGEGLLCATATPEKTISAALLAHVAKMGFMLMSMSPGKGAIQRRWKG